MRPEIPVFRFAPSPNGRLHLGHAYSALLNAHLAGRLGGRLLLRIEDIDPSRSRPELIEAITSDLAWLGLPIGGPVRRQSEHLPTYRAALDRLIARGLAYPCFCSRGGIRATAGEAAPCDPDGVPLYPGTCRRLDRAVADARRISREPHAWRLDMARALADAPGPHGYRAFDAGRLMTPLDRSRIPPGEGTDPERFTSSPGRTRDRLPTDGDAELRPIVAHPARWGDPVIARRDVPTSYHLSVVIDDAAQAVTHVVRGQDLEAATDLHALLQTLLGLPVPRYHHHALVRGQDGEKLAKSKGSETLADLRDRGATPDAIRKQLGFE